MKQSDRDIVKALDWFAELLAKNMREYARRVDPAHHISTEVERARSETLNDVADMIEETRRDMKRIIGSDA
jgi:hypothetical protein